MIRKISIYLFITMILITSCSAQLKLGNGIFRNFYSISLPYRFAGVNIGTSNSNTGNINSTLPYFIHQTIFATSNADVQDPAFFFAGYYSTQNGGPNGESDVVCPNNVLLLGFAINWNGTWHRANIPVAGVNIASGFSGVWEFMNGITIPKNTDVTEQVVAYVPNGGQMCGRGYSSTDDTKVAAATLGTASSGLLNMFADNGGTLSGVQNGLSNVIYPAMMVGRVNTTSPIFLIMGDSIGGGSNDNAGKTARHIRGFINLGLDDNITTKRLAFSNLSVAGTSPLQMTTISNWQGRYNMLQQIKSFNEGRWPFTRILSEHGTNSLGASLKDTVMPNYFLMLRSVFAGIPITQTELLSRPTSSSDGWQTLGSITIQPYDSYSGRSTANGGDNTGAGGRWDTNIAIGGSNGLGAITNNSEYYQLGYIDDSFAPWRYDSYDTGANRDKFALISFSSTLAADYTAGTATASVTGSCPPDVGHTMILFGATTPSDSNDKSDNTVTGVSGGSPCTVSVNWSQNGTAGWAVTLSMRDRTGLHPSTYDHRNLIINAVLDWKIAKGWI